MSDATLPANEDIRLSCAFIGDPSRRADVLSLQAFLETLREIPERVNEPLMGEIRLRWWYEAVEEIRDGRPVRYHPLTEALERVIGQYGLAPEAFLDMVEGQMPLLDKGALTVEAALGVVDRGEGGLARLAAQVLGEAPPPVEAARFHAMARLKSGRGLSDAGDAELAHLRCAAVQAIKGVSTGALPLVLPAALAERLWQGRPYGPLAKRIKLLWAFLTGQI